MEKVFNLSENKKRKLIADGLDFTTFKATIEGEYDGFKMEFGFYCCDYVERSQELKDFLAFCDQSLGGAYRIKYDGISMPNIDENTFLPTEEYLHCVEVSCASVCETNVGKFFDTIYNNLPCRFDSYRHFVDGAELAYGNYDIDEFLKKDHPVIVTDESSDAFHWYRSYKNKHPEAKVIKISFYACGSADCFYLDRSLLTDEEFAIADREFCVIEID